MVCLQNIWRAGPCIGRCRLESLRAAFRETRAAVAGLPGVWVEDKGGTAAVHSREAPGEAVRRLREAVREVAARLPAGVRLDAGRCVYDLRPDDPAGGKLAAIRDVLAEAGAPGNALRFYFGDDETDEGVFAGLGGTS